MAKGEKTGYQSIDDRQADFDKIAKDQADKEKAAQMKEQ